MKLKKDKEVIGKVNTHVLTREGTKVHEGTYHECWIRLLQVQGYSTQHALKYGGWNITKI